MENKSRNYIEIRGKTRLLFPIVEILWKNHARFTGFMVVSPCNRDKSWILKPAIVPRVFSFFFSFIYELTSLRNIIIYRTNFLFYIVSIYIFFSMLLETKRHIVENIDVNIEKRNNTVTKCKYFYNCNIVNSKILYQRWLQA